MKQHSKPVLLAIILALTLLALACNAPWYKSRLTSPTLEPDLVTLTSPAPQNSSPLAPPTPTLASVPSPALTLVSSPEALSPTPTTYQPVFEPAGCAFPVPTGYPAECGYLVVPENRTLPDSPSIRLHVAIFRSNSGTPDPYPVVHLAGGPGSSSLEVAGYLFQQGLGAVLEGHDLILFDQRGTGYSIPRLDCPEREGLTAELLENTLSPDEERAKILNAFRLCREHLTGEGIDLPAYNSAASAADIDDLRRALGYQALNLYGVSYGTRLALTVLRDDPQAVRSVVLDSTYPLQVNLYTDLAPNAGRAFRALFDRCAGDPACSVRYPKLEERFYELVDQLNDSPFWVDLSPGRQSGPTILVDGDLLIDVLFGGLYNPAVTVSMPKMIDDIRHGETTILRDRLQLYFDTSTALGMQMSVQCSEELPFNTPDEAVTAAQGVRPQIAAFFTRSAQTVFESCWEWSSASPDPRENQPVNSSLPALIFAGEFDPITPPAWGQMVAMDLSDARFYEFPGNGHWVTRSSDCALSLALAFWNDPNSPLDTTCTQSMESLKLGWW